MQRSIPPRPLTHDLFRTFISKFDITLEDALIYKYENGVFYSMLSFKQHGEIVKVESRTSDAVAIALRTKSPIYTTEEIMQELAVVFNDSDSALSSSPPHRPISVDVVSDMDEEDTLDELKERLQEAIEDENYELASEIRDEISRKMELKN